MPRRWRRRKPGGKVNKWYDLEEDWELIEASFVTQYNIRLIESDMDWKEFSTLLHSIMPDTPLGQIVSVRAEEDKDMLKHFTPEQHSIRNAWRNKHSILDTMTEKQKEESVKTLQEILASAFG